VRRSREGGVQFRMSRTEHQPDAAPESNTGGGQAGSGITGAGAPGGGSGAGGLGAAGSGGGIAAGGLGGMSTGGPTGTGNLGGGGGIGGDPTHGLGGTTDTIRPDQEATPGAGSGLGLSGSTRRGNPPDDQEGRESKRGGTR
jgi:hypothetical protein